MNPYVGISGMFYVVCINHNSNKANKALRSQEILFQAYIFS